MNHDDSRLTAYALNELDQADRAEVEAFLQQDEPARRFVEEIRQTAATVSQGLQSAQLPTLTMQQREAITAAAGASQGLSYQAPARKPQTAWARWALATAACAALAAGGFVVLHGSLATSPKRVVIAPVSQPKSDPKEVREVIDVLTERTKEAIRHRQFKQALGVMDQLHDLDVNNEFVHNTKPLVEKSLKLQAARGEQPPRDREYTHQLNQAVNTPSYQDVLRFPESMPDFSLSDGTSKTSGGPGGGGGFGEGGRGGLQTGREVTKLADPAAITLHYTTPNAMTAGPANPNQQRGQAAVGQVTFDLKNNTDIVSSPTVVITGATVGNSIVGQSGQLYSTNGATLDPAAPAPSSPLAADGAVQGLGSQPAGTAYARAGTGSGGTTDLYSVVPLESKTRLPDSIQIRKDETSYRFTQNLATARQAVARNDQDGARRALAESRGWLEKESATLTPNEVVEYKIQLQQLEWSLPGSESYAAINDNPFNTAIDQPLSTFSIDVDTASYANIRRFIDQGHLPPPDAVRIEEMLNYFPYSYEKPAPDSKEPFKATVEVAGCPWNSDHRLARIAIKGKELAHDKRPVANLVLLIDVSGSMNEPKKLPLVKEGLKLMVNELTENDRISIVVYAGTAGLVLPSTCADPQGKGAILAAIDNLSAGGSTNGGQGIELAYRIATENFIKGGTNRVMLATDGDWNVGVTDQSSLINLIQDKAKSGVFLSVLGFGFGNLKDSTMEKLADKGNGHYAYIDGIKEARKVLVEEMSGTLVTIAKDVKIQVEFNPAKVQSYRLIGYENRMLRKEDFNNDKVDAGEIGAGHSVTALYELTPTTKFSRDPKGSAPTTQPQTTQPETDPLKYQKHELVESKELFTLKLRYKQPDGDKSTKLEIPAIDQGLTYSKASEDFKFSAAVAQFGMILRNSPAKGTASLDGVIELADEAKGKDEKGYRAEFIDLAKKVKALSK